MTVIERKENICYLMTLPTAKQMIDKLSKFDIVVLGALSKTQIIGLSNDFFIGTVLSKVEEEITDLQYAFRIINKNRTLWIVSTSSISIPTTFNSLKQCYLKY